MVANANEAFVKVLLGLILIGYGLYGLTRPSPRRPCSPRWAYLAGFVSGSHALANHLTPTVLRLYAWTPPALLLGILAGLWVDRFVDKERCRLLVLAMILVLGLSLALNFGRR
jgi:uncharacterized membrane protein YfcA